ncbi:hypothetical protein CL632_01040 [bacterium]|nr:hypothetical protein [bacterium]
MTQESVDYEKEAKELKIHLSEVAKKLSMTAWQTQNMLTLISQRLESGLVPEGAVDGDMASVPCKG